MKGIGHSPTSILQRGPGPFLYHLYDDRGLDVLGGSQKLLSRFSKNEPELRAARVLNEEQPAS